MTTANKNLGLNHEIETCLSSALAAQLPPSRSVYSYAQTVTEVQATSLTSRQVVYYPFELNVTDDTLEERIEALIDGVFDVLTDILDVDPETYERLVHEKPEGSRDVDISHFVSSKVFRNDEGVFTALIDGGAPIIPEDYRFYCKISGEPSSKDAGHITGQVFLYATPAIVATFDVYGNPQLPHDRSNVGEATIAFYQPKVNSLSQLSTNITEVFQHSFRSGMKYLYAGIDVNSLISAYLESSENILFLFGKPGTGKTSLARDIIGALPPAPEVGQGTSAVNRRRVVYIKDVDLLSSPELWRWLNANAENLDAVVLDDLDVPLLPRLANKDSGDDKGHNVVSNLLSFANGILANSVKIIITSNLAFEAVDPALLRPGRCFDVLELSPLTCQEAADIWVNKFGMSLQTFEEVFSSRVRDQKSITQAHLVSEFNRAVSEETKKNYLLDHSVSKRLNFT